MQFLTLSHRYCPPMHHHSSAISRRVSTSRSSSVSLRCAIHTPSIVTDEVKFSEASRNGNLVPLYRSIFADHLTPVLAYRCLVKQKDWEAPSFLFESVESDSRSSQVGRYSIVGSDPALEIIAKEHTVTIVDHENGSSKEEVFDNPFEIPKSISSSWKPQLLDGLPDTFCGGWAGYFSYDTVRYIEKKVSFQDAPNDDHKLPDIHLGLYQDVVVFDHVQKKAYAIHWVRLDCYSSVEEAYSAGVKRLQRLVSKIQNVNHLSQGYIGLSRRHFSTPLKNSSMTNDEYKEKVLKAQEHILAGEIFHIVLSQRFERRTFANPFEVYRSLRTADPSPYMAYLQAKGCILVGSSPEIILRTEKNTIVNRPLAGTVRRGKNASEDELLAKKLLSDEKECVEHTMLVDMGRNDVGKVSKPGSVKVEKLMSIKRYSHVMHISSAVTGELLEHVTCWDALHASLPVGSVSGAPKVKAMELIDKLEVTRRGPYSGGFGWISFTGEMDIALSLRTMVFPTTSHDAMYTYKTGDSWKEWTAYMQAGAGIVAESVPEDEQQECEDKVADMTCAIDPAETTFLGD